ncbi:MAG: hypothetical protein ACRC4M_02715 [Mycoplasma sp.]
MDYIIINDNNELSIVDSTKKIKLFILNTYKKKKHLMKENNTWNEYCEECEKPVRNIHGTIDINEMSYCWDCFKKLGEYWEIDEDFGKNNEERDELIEQKINEMRNFLKGNNYI